MNAIFENILIMFLTIVVLLGGGYLMLLLIGFGLKLKSGNRENQGLTDLWIANQSPAVTEAPDDVEDELDPPSKP